MSGEKSTTNLLRRVREEERPLTLGIINAAAGIYRGAIPGDCWHEPYMSDSELAEEIRAGVEFWGYLQQGRLVGVMGTQTVRDVDLIRHAYVHPSCQGRGVGGALIGTGYHPQAPPGVLAHRRAADRDLRGARQSAVSVSR